MKTYSKTIKENQLFLDCLGCWDNVDDSSFKKRKKPETLKALHVSELTTATDWYKMVNQLALKLCFEREKVTKYRFYLKKKIEKTYMKAFKKKLNVALVILSNNGKESNAKSTYKSLGREK